MVPSDLRLPRQITVDMPWSPQATGNQSNSRSAAPECELCGVVTGLWDFQCSPALRQLPLQVILRDMIHELDTTSFLAPGGDGFSLGDFATDIEKLYKSKSAYREQLKKNVKGLRDFQRKLYAHNQYAVLLVFQGMDASGKDGAIRHVFSGINPQGCQVFSFKQPSSEELNHDYLWRIHQRVPERGHFGIFNRSHYEEVLIARQEPAVIEGQRLPMECRNRPDFWEERYQDIVQFEDYLRRNGTVIIKFYLHLSHEEQLKRLLSRIDDADKNWKFADADLDVRSKWDEYEVLYEEALRKTSKANAPWYVVPADNKKNARLIISQILINELTRLPVEFPEVTDARRDRLQSIRKKLAGDS